VSGLASASSEQVHEIAAASAVHGRELLLSERRVLDWRSPWDLVRKLDRIAAQGRPTLRHHWGTITETNAPVVVVRILGDGSQ
jgi:hypothetical protein